MDGDRSRVDKDRIRDLKDGVAGRGPVIYWMTRDQRVDDNWGLIYAQDVALAASRPLEVLFCLTEDFPGATVRSYDFMLRGLSETAERLKTLNISFGILKGHPPTALASHMEKLDPAMVVVDFSPIRAHKSWIAAFAARHLGKIRQVDSHNLVPCWVASDKKEYSARTIRPKIAKKLSLFTRDFPRIERHPYGFASVDPVPEAKDLQLDGSVSPISIPPGSEAGKRALLSFLEERLHRYGQDRNDPNAKGTSGLSPYLHFGQISPQRTVQEAIKAGLPGSDAFVEEVLVRRELSDNHCHYEPNYDIYRSLPQWGRKTLDDHRQDRRPRIYDRRSLEEAATDDGLWNYAQRSLLKEGRIHGYLRMYWGKMILLWSPSPEEAFATAMDLNDRYAIDGRDPNGYVGISWCIGGLHDRPWPGRPVFGTVRSMSFSGCAKKFDVEKLLEQAI